MSDSRMEQNGDDYKVQTILSVVLFNSPKVKNVTVERGLGARCCVLANFFRRVILLTVVISVKKRK